MSRQLSGVVQNVEKLLALQPEELGFVILQILNREPSAVFDRLGLFQELTQGLVDASRSGLVVAEAVGEAMSSLESGGYLASRPASDRKILLFVTRRGREASGGLDALAFRNSTLLPASLLHPAVAQRAQAAFLRGEYDTAVFTAFKAVEVAARNAAGLPNTFIGVALMREAE